MIERRSLFGFRSILISWAGTATRWRFWRRPSTSSVSVAG